MKKQDLFLLINFVIMVLIGIGFGMVNQSQTLTEPKDKLFDQRITLENEQKLESIPYMSSNSVNFEKVDIKWTAKDEDGKTIGFVYHAIAKNDFALSGSGIDYGFIEILVGISLDGKVNVEYVNVYQSQWAIVGIQKYIQDNYDDVNYKFVGTIPKFDADIVSGATENPATVSTDIVKALVQSAIAIHYNISEVDPIEELYGEGATTEVDSGFAATTHILAKQTVYDNADQVIGYLYEVTQSGVYNGDNEGSILLQICFDTNDEIVGFVLPDDEYTHTGGYKDDNLDYMASFEGLTISEISAKITELGDISTGATNSRRVITAALEDFVSEVN